MYRVAAVLAALLAGAIVARAQNDEFEALHAHFERVVGERFERLFADVRSVAGWEARKRSSRRALERMLWHERSWPAGPPAVRITGRVERADYVVENIILETGRGIYSTGNLYLPRAGGKPYPVILYQCGHANKTVFKHHGAWFAARGIAVMVMDNIEMGEMQFTHHGVYSHAWFHWYSRGFSPMAVELFNARRTLDYLSARDDLDSERIGATGISGGGMATFFLAALDERVKASAPVSGALSTSGWVKHRLSVAHCDCQYPVNSHGMMYSEIGALVAPRAQLLSNADADRGFPMDAFNEMAGKMREVYRLYGADEALRVSVVAGGHKDTEVIRLPVYEFFLKELLDVRTAVEWEGPVDVPPDEELRCFREGFPLDERLTRIDEELLPAPAADWSVGELAEELRREVFRYFPREGGQFAAKWEDSRQVQGRAVRDVSFNSFPDLRVRGVYSLPRAWRAGSKLPGMLVLDHRKGIPVWGNEQATEANRWGERAVLVVEGIDRGSRALEVNLRSFRDDDDLHHLRREAMVAGTTLASMRVYEAMRSLEFLRARPEVDAERITVTGRGAEGITALYAALLDGAVSRVIVGSPPVSHRAGPHYLGVLRYTDIPEVITLMRDKVRLYGEVPRSVRAELAGASRDERVVAPTLAEWLQEPALR